MQWPKRWSMRRSNQRNAIDCLEDGTCMLYRHIATLLHCQESRSWWQESGGMLMPDLGGWHAPSSRWKGTCHIAISYQARGSWWLIRGGLLIPCQSWKGGMPHARQGGACHSWKGGVARGGIQILMRRRHVAHTWREGNTDSAVLLLHCFCCFWSTHFCVRSCFRKAM